MTAETDFPELQKGQLKVASSFCLAAFGGGLLDFRFPMVVFLENEGYVQNASTGWLNL